MSRSVRDAYPWRTEYQVGKLESSVHPFPIHAQPKREYQTGKLDLATFPSETKHYTVAQIAPLNVPLGKGGYAAIESVLLNIAKELPHLDGRSIASYVVCAQGSRVPASIKAIETVKDLDGWHGPGRRELERPVYEKHFRALAAIPQLNLIHNHTGEFPEYLMSHPSDKPVVHTVHVDYDAEKLDFTKTNNSFYVAISESHKRELEKRGIPIHRVVYNGVEISDFPFHPQKSEYLLSLSRITPIKGQLEAIHAAKRAGKKLVIAGNVQPKPEDHNYFETQIKPHLELELNFEQEWTLNKYEAMKKILETDKQIIYCGEAKKSKADLYGHARALLFPITWPEPFGLVMVEAMSTGTPVIAYRNGSVPELITPGKNGFIADDLEEMVAAIEQSHTINPAACRAVAEQFSNKRMAENYAALYEEVLGM